MVAHSAVEEQDTTTKAPSSSSSPSRPLGASSTFLSTPHSDHHATSPSSSSPPSSSSSVSQSHRQRPSNQCVASPIPGPDLLDHQPPLPLLDPVPTHFPLFPCKVDFLLITRTAAMLERSGFYWGPLGVEEAHSRLKDVATGTFLIRDSRQKDVFFTLSYRAASGPVSVRIVYKGQRFSLAGSEHSFPCLFFLLEHYIHSSKKSLTVPYRKQRPTLQELCRKQVAESCGGEVERVARVPVNPILKHFLLEFPYRI
ncbi:suppressor of cytokine signaling 1a [Oncorhynchus tshawytscha]|uniref:Suppressor of cytokine signaling 1 n=1 Tax=Oncorhynchus tshawytscha TaxID=74940 RepID=A0A8C8ME85_ONCTS|nr:suppressor of cytokine signaling 1a [Oncorhynchus tshawytscha]